MKPFLSLCMIVKNEERVIDRCLMSVAHLVDEIIIVDTGSTDTTKDIAFKYTPNIYDFEWIGDFSAARNFVASKANGQWILVLDADEYVEEENFKDFIEEIKSDEEKFDSYAARILNFTGHFGEGLIQNYHDRIYKNNGEINYYRKIHEQFQNKNGNPLASKKAGLVIFHSGYLNKVVNEKDKKVRNKELLDKEMNAGKNKAFDYFNFGNEYFSAGEYVDALSAYKLAYELKDDFRLSWVATTLIQITLCLMHLYRYQDALEVIKEAEQLYATSPEFMYLKGEVFFIRGQMDDAKHIFHQLINNNHLYNHVLARPDLKDQLPNKRLGEIYLFEKDYQNSIFHFVSVLNINKYNDEGIRNVIYILSKFHHTEEITQFLISKDLLNDNNINTYVKICFELGNPDLAISLILNCHDENHILYKIALLKKLSINKEGSIQEISELLNPKVLLELRSSNWINSIDLYLLRDQILKENMLDLLQFLDQDIEYKKIVELFENNGVEDKLNSSVVVFALKILINYKQFLLCDILLKNVDKMDDEVLPVVAAILFENGFKAEALHFYEKCNWNFFMKHDFINIIDSLLETNQDLNVIEVAQYAILLYSEDFRFYKYILEHSNDNEVFSTTLMKAQEIFSESIYMEKYSI
jgi:glycosyltransferase involved in cell wall biosynthesis